jgi:hypothetical protein
VQVPCKTSDYAKCQTLRPGEELRLAIDEQDCGSIAVSELLP